MSNATSCCCFAGSTVKTLIRVRSLLSFEIVGMAGFQAVTVAGPAAVLRSWDEGEMDSRGSAGGARAHGILGRVEIVGPPTDRYALARVQPPPDLPAQACLVPVDPRSACSNRPIRGAAARR